MLAKWGITLRQISSLVFFIFHPTASFHANETVCFILLLTCPRCEHPQPYEDRFEKKEEFCERYYKNYPQFFCLPSFLRHLESHLSFSLRLLRGSFRLSTTFHCYCSIFYYCVFFYFRLDCTKMCSSCLDIFSPFLSVFRQIGILIV